MIFDELPIGQSVEGNAIDAFIANAKKGARYLYLMSGTHGDEVEGVFVLKKFFEYLKDNHNLPDIPVVVVPILNIDGYRAGRRANSNGVDLNRNYKTSTWIETEIQSKNYSGKAPLSEPENIFLEKLFNKYHPALVLSFHSWKPILNFNGDCEDVATFIHQFNQYPVAGDIGYPTPGSLGTYLPETYQCPVLTYECPLIKESKKALDEVWQENERGLIEFIKSDLLIRKLA